MNLFLYWLIPEEPTHENMKNVLSFLDRYAADESFFWLDLVTGIAPTGFLRQWRKQIIAAKPIDRQQY